MLSKLALSFSLISFILLITLSLIFYSKLSTLEQNIKPPKSSDELVVNKKSTQDPSLVAKNENNDADVDLQNMISAEVSKAVATISAQLKTQSSTTVSQQASLPQKTQIPKAITTYIPLNSTYTTGSQSWVDVPNSEFVLNLNSDYGTNAQAFMEVYLKQDQGNGTSFLRLFDKTHSIVVGNSEVQTSSQTSTLINSAKLQFWNGTNTYVVQVKSLTGYSVVFDGGRIKINY